MSVDGPVTRAVVFTLDPSPAEERLLRSYCGAARKAYNWAIGEVIANLAVRKAEREAGIPEDQLTPALSWSAWALSKRWNSAKELEAPWWREVSMHAFRSGITAAADALKRALYLHGVTNALASSFDVVAVEDLNVSGMANRKRRLGRRLADVGLGELRRQLTYKTANQGHRLVAVGRSYPSSKMCSSCGAVKAKLPLWERVFTCEECGAVSDRDVNAARNIALEAARLLAHAPNSDHDQGQQNGAGLRPESANASLRPHKTSEAQAERAGSPEGGTKESSSREVAA